MTSPALLARFGLFVQERFLDAELCGSLADEMRSASGHPATVRVLAEDGVAYEVDDEHRRTQMAEVSEASVSLIEGRLVELRPALEQHFSLALSTIQSPQFLVYREGDFFRPHVDNATEQVVGDGVSRRRISVVMFINGREEYDGGALTFYGLFDNPTGDTIGIPLEADEGLLITFPSGMLHAVAPVTHGERYTIATWFF